MVHITPHFSITAPAYGKVGTEIYNLLRTNMANKNDIIYLIKTKMAGINSDELIAHLTSLNLKSTIETNDELKKLVEVISQKSDTKAIIMAAAICDFEPDELSAYEGENLITIRDFGKDKKRLHKAHFLELKLKASAKIINIIKKSNPHIFLVTFKTTAGETEEKLIEKSRYNLKRSQSDMVFGNDIQNRINLIVTEKEEVFRAESREEALKVFCRVFWEKY